MLDAGCAAGWYTAWLLEHGAEVTAIDLSLTMIEMPRRRVGDRAMLFQADMNEPLAFLEDESFDLVLSSLTLHYLKNWGPVLGEFFRGLKPGGKPAFLPHHSFIDYLVFNLESYFETSLLTDRWSTPDGRWQCSFTGVLWVRFSVRCWGPDLRWRRWKSQCSRKRFGRRLQQCI